MSDWASGYQADIDYLYGYYAELNPLRMRLAFAASGLVAPEIRTACELGFGQGISVNLHAAASTVDWYGTDFMPAQASFARDLAAASGAPATLYDEAFAEFAIRSDLPEFDYIALHGVWSWVSQDNREVIVDFLRRKLRPGGVVYVGYNTLPGWAPLAPIQHLLARHAEVLDAPGTAVSHRVDNALGFVERLLATNPGYARAVPHLGQHIAREKDKDRHYLSHEYFNRHWSPAYFSALAEALAPAKLKFACSAYYLDHFDALHLLDQQRAFLAGISEPVMRQTVRDFMVNQDFRRDFWVKGPRHLSLLEQTEALQGERVVLVHPRGDVELKVKGALGEMALSDAVYNPILDALSNHQPWTLGQLAQAVAGKGLSFPQVMQAAMMLMGLGRVAAAADEATRDRTQAQSDRLNDFVLQSARGRTDIRYMASPVVGGGVRVQQFDQLFLLGLRQGRKEPAELAEFVWQILAAQGQKITREGRPIETVSENLNELNLQALNFRDKVLPILSALGIAR